MSTEILNKEFEPIDLESLRKVRINLVIFGHGNVGSELIEQIFKSKQTIAKRRNLDLNIIAIANSGTILMDPQIDEDWRLQKKIKGIEYTVDDLIRFSKINGFTNMIAIDNTASSEFVENYPKLISNGFNLVSSNKIANTVGLEFYRNVRELLRTYNKEYLYETNVGAGLPLIDTIKLLHLSGENITRIRGVFSGSLSYLFNKFSGSGLAFSEILEKAVKHGLTEPDPREDLSGKDVARKLLILARELELVNELSDVYIENLVPLSMQRLNRNEFLESLDQLDRIFQQKKNELPAGYVLRYVADLYGDLSKDDGGKLDVKLATIPKTDSLGQLKGSDSIFEIYTESYGRNPIVIQGAGAGATVTARGVFGDILRLSEKLNSDKNESST